MPMPDHHPNLPTPFPQPNTIKVIKLYKSYYSSNILKIKTFGHTIQFIFNKSIETPEEIKAKGEEGVYYITKSYKRFKPREVDLYKKHWKRNLKPSAEVLVWFAWDQFGYLTKNRLVIYRNKKQLFKRIVFIFINKNELQFKPYKLFDIKIFNPITNKFTTIKRFAKETHLPYSPIMNAIYHFVEGKKNI
jgi:hypothetical protein